MSHSDSQKALEGDGIRTRAFNVSEEDLDSGCRQIRVEGELDLSVADQLHERLDAALLDDVDVLVSLERCDFIDSTGIAALIRAHSSMASRGRRLQICNPSGQVSRILGITGLDHAGLIYDSAEAALADRFEASISGPAQASGGEAVSLQ